MIIHCSISYSMYNASKLVCPYKLSLKFNVWFQWLLHVWDLICGITQYSSTADMQMVHTCTGCFSLCVQICTLLALFNNTFISGVSGLESGKPQKVKGERYKKDGYRAGINRQEHDKDAKPVNQQQMKSTKVQTLGTVQWSHAHFSSACSKIPHACTYVYVSMRIRDFRRKNGHLYVWPYDGRSAGSRQRSGFSENFWPSLLVEYVTSISGWTDAPEVRCGLTDRQTHRQTNPTTVTLAAHAHWGLHIHSYNIITSSQFSF